MKNVLGILKNNKVKSICIAACVIVIAVLIVMFASCSSMDDAGDTGKGGSIGGALTTAADASVALGEGSSEASDDQQGSAPNGSETGASATASAAAGIQAQDTQGVSAQQGGSTSAAQSQPGIEHPTPSASQKRWVEDTQQVWVEDKAAWSEQVPVYGNKEISICNVCGADVTGNAAVHGKAHMLAGEGSGHHSEVRREVTGYETVNHPAEGHYETRVAGGHWE